MIYVLAPSPGPTGRHRPEHESLDRGEDVFPIVLYDIMPKDKTHNHSSKWFTIDRIILYRKTDMGKSHPVIRASQMTPLTWQHLPVPVHLCKYVCMCEKCPVDNCWQQTAVTMSLSEGSNSRGHANTLSVWPQIPLHPRMTVKWQSLYAGCRCAASSSDIQTMVQNAKEGQLAQGKLSFLKTVLSYTTWSHGINVPGCPF